MVWITAFLVVLLATPARNQVPPRKMANKPASPVADPGEYTCFARKFFLPVRIESNQDQIRWLVLYCSTDRGNTWKMYKHMPADNRTFTVEVESDGSYWFSLEVIGPNGRRSPATLRELKPDIKMRVITTK